MLLCEVGRSAVALSVPSQWEPWAAGRLEPYLRTTPVPSRPAESWLLSVRRPPVGRDFQAVDVTAPGEPRTVLRISRPTRELVVDGAVEPAFAAHTAVRYVRILLRLMEAAGGALFLHAGLIHHGRGVAVVGDKRAGKTSTILSALQRDAAFVSNDDLSVYREDGRWRGQGWPRAVAVRADTFEALGIDVAEEVRRHGRTLTHPAAAGTPLPPQGSDERIFFYPQELASLLDAPLAAHHGLDAVVFPAFAEGPARLRRLDRDETAHRLHHNVLPKPVKHADFLFEHFTVPDTTATAGLVDRLADDIAGYELTQSFGALSKGTALLQNLLREDRLEPHRC